MKKSNISHFTAKDIDSIYPIEVKANPFPWSKKTFASCIGGRYITKTLAVDDTIIGFYVAEFVIDELTLMEICISPEQQGKGYGQILINDFIKEAKAKSCVVCHLEVRSKNIAAQMLYMKNGFIQVNRRTGYYPAAIGYEDAIVMSLSL